MILRTEEVSYFSDGSRIRASWRAPDSHDGESPLRAIIQGPGWLGLREAALYRRYHQALTDAGFGVLIIDYRGFGDSEGERGRLSPRAQLEDLVNGVTYLTTRRDVDHERIGVFGSGGTGGGNAVLLAAADSRIRAAVSQLPVADGADWLHRMRAEHEWLSFLGALEADRRERVLAGQGRLVHPREEIMVPTPERKATTAKADVDGRIPSKVALATVDELLEYRPIDAARRLDKPLMVIAVEDDATTPTDHAVAIHEAARGPRELLMQRNTTHYAAYDQYWRLVTPRIVEWFARHLVNGPIAVRTATGTSSGHHAEHLTFLGGTDGSS